MKPKHERNTEMKPIMKLLMLLVLALPVTVLGAGPYTLRESEASASKNSWTTATQWLQADGATPLASWDANGDYIVRDGYSFRSPQGDAAVVFSAHTLTIGDLSKNESGVLRPCCRALNGGYLDFTQDGLVLAKGEIKTEYGADQSFRLNGKITVTAPSTASFQIWGDYNNADISLTGSLHGQAGTAFHSGSRVKALRLLCDCSDFYGKFTVQNAGTMLQLDTASFPGEIRHATSNPSLEVLQKTTIGTLTLGSGAVIAVTKPHAPICVFSSFTHDGSIQLEIDSSANPCDGSSSMILLEVPGENALSKSDLTVSIPDDFISPSWDVVNGDDGSGNPVTRVMLSYEPMVKLVLSDSKDQGNGASFGSAMTNAASWSDGKLPHADAHYYVGSGIPGGGASDNDTTITTYLRTPVQTDSTVIEFPCKSLTFGKGCCLTVLAKYFHCAKLRFLDGSCLRNGQSTKFNIDATSQVEFVDGTVSAALWGGCDCYIHAPISGAAVVKLVGSIMSTSSPHGYLVPDGDNSHFAGSYLVSPYRTSTEASHSSLRLYHDKSVGSTLAEVNPRAFAVEKYSSIEAQGNVTISNASNRGIFVGDHGEIFVRSNCQFVNGTLLTVNGHAFKRGPGVLKMNGPARFGANAAMDPVTDGVDNLLDVVAGSISVGDSDALNGLKTTFMSGTALLLPVDLANASLTRYGIANVKTETPFVLGSGLEKLPLTVAFPTEFALAGNEQFVGIITVANAQADAVAALLPPVASPKVKGFSSKWTTVSEGGKTTFGFLYKKCGLVLVFK